MTDLALVGSSKSWKGLWCPSRKVRSVTILGSTEVDFRQARLAQGVTELALFTLFGATDVIVTSDMPVNLSGFSLLGVRTMKRSQAKQMPSPTAKSLHVRGISIFGRLSVKDLP